MTPASITPLYSTGMIELNALFNDLQRPYGKAEIVRFNLAFQRTYPQLTRSERRRAEVLADALVFNLEDDQLVRYIAAIS